MSIVTTDETRSADASRSRPPENCSVDRLVQRLSAEVDAAEKRVQLLQADAAKCFFGQEQQLMRFAAVAERIQAILLPRLEAITTLNVFQDIKQRVSLERRGPEARGFDARTTTLTVPYSDKRPAPMELSFRVGHDGPFENAVLDFRLQILPILITFDSDDQLVILIDRPNEEAIGAWIDDKLVGFTQTYFQVYFHDEYQKANMELDPVMKIRFPKAYAAGKKEYEKRTYHFYTKESLERFVDDPAEYVE